MTGLAPDDITRIRDQLFFDGPERNRRLSRFLLLLPLAAVIASAGVVSDSTATVIGATVMPPSRHTKTSPVAAGSRSAAGRGRGAWGERQREEFGVHRRSASIRDGPRRVLRQPDVFRIGGNARLHRVGPAYPLKLR